MKTSTAFLNALSNRILVGDGAMGTQLQGFEMSLDRDFLGLEGCNEILNVTRPDIVASIHRVYFEAGADFVETNTFGCNLPNLADYGIADRCEELAYEGARIARDVAAEFEGKLVVGALGPGTKLPSLGHALFDDLSHHYTLAPTRSSSKPLKTSYRSNVPCRPASRPLQTQKLNCQSGFMSP